MNAKDIWTYPSRVYNIPEEVKQDLSHNTNDESESEDENSNFVAFIVRHGDGDDSQEDIQELLEAYTLLQSKWQELIRVNAELMQKN